MTEAERDTPRDPEKESAVIRAALHEFARLGYRAADVQVIADRAGVGKGTVYRYFESKEGLFKAVAHAGMRALERKFRDLIAEGRPFLELARAMVVVYGTFFQEHPEFVEIMIQERAEFRGTTPDTHQYFRERNEAEMEALIQSAIDDGTLRPIDARRTLKVVGDAIYGTVTRGVIEGRADRLVSDAEYMLDIVLDGIQA